MTTRVMRNLWTGSAISLFSSRSVTTATVDGVAYLRCCRALSPRANNTPLTDHCPPSGMRRSWRGGPLPCGADPSESFSRGIAMTIRVPSVLFCLLAVLASHGKRRKAHEGDAEQRLRTEVRANYDDRGPYAPEVD